MKNRGFDFSLVGREADHPLYPRRDIPGLNVLKFFCALMIVQIHTDSTLKPYVLYVCRIAVPLFLMITGYFMLNDRGGITAGKMAATFWKILKIFVYATVVSILFRFVTAPNEFIGNELSLKTLKWFVLSGSNFNAAYWYLYSLLQALVVILVFVRIGHPNWLWGVAIVGITANLLLGSYSFFYRPEGFHIIISRNVFTVCIPSLMAGAFIRLNEDRLPGFRKTLFLASVFLILATFEEFFIHHRFASGVNGDILLFTLPLAIFVFATCMKIPSDRFSLLAALGRKHSLNIFLYHILLADAVVMAFGHGFSDTLTFITIILSLILSSAILFLKNRLHKKK